MLRGDICLVDLEPDRGAEANKRRPAVIVSNDRGNTAADRLGRGVVTVVPVTSNVGRIYPFQMLLPAVSCGLQQDSKAKAEQIRCIAAERIGPILGRVPAADMADSTTRYGYTCSSDADHPSAAREAGAIHARQLPASGGHHRQRWDLIYRRRSTARHDSALLPLINALGSTLPCASQRLDHTSNRGPWNAIVRSLP